MTMDELAQSITGREYPLRLTKEEVANAKACGLVVCYGASDDLLEFEGAINDEVGALNGTTRHIDCQGLVPTWDDINQSDRGQCRALIARERLPSFEVRALWDPGDGYSWKIETDAPHATFEIVEDGAPFCRGVVFELPADDND